MKNITKQYQELLEGKISRDNFVRNVRMQFPEYISPVTSLDDAVKILKSKRIITEGIHDRDITSSYGMAGHVNPRHNDDAYARMVRLPIVRDMAKDMSDYDFQELLQQFGHEEFWSGDKKATIDSLPVEVLRDLTRDYGKPSSVKEMRHFGKWAVNDITPEERAAMDRVINKSNPSNSKTFYLVDDHGKVVDSVKAPDMTSAENHFYNEYEGIMSGLTVTDIHPESMYENTDDDDLEATKEEARKNSEEGYVQHVNKGRYGYTVSDWYDADSTVASYQNGRELNEGTEEMLAPEIKRAVTKLDPKETQDLIIWLKDALKKKLGSKSTSPSLEDPYHTGQKASHEFGGVFERDDIEALQAGALREAYRDLNDNLTIVKNCINLGKRNPSKWGDLASAALEIQQEYSNTKDESSLDEAVENLLDEYNPPKSVIPYETTKGSLREAVEKSEGKWKDVTGEKEYSIFDEIDRVNPYEFKKGLEMEMNMRFKPTPNFFTADFNPETLAKAARKVLKNLEKHPAYYTNNISAEFEKKSGLSQNPKEVKVKADGATKIKGFTDAKSNTETTLSKRERAKGKPEGVKEMKPSKKGMGGIKMMKSNGKLPKGVEMMKEDQDLSKSKPGANIDFTKYKTGTDKETWQRLSHEDRIKVLTAPTMMKHIGKHSGNTLERLANATWDQLTTPEGREKLGLAPYAAVLQGMMFTPRPSESVENNIKSQTVKESTMKPGKYDAMKEALVKELKEEIAKMKKMKEESTLLQNPDGDIVSTETPQGAATAKKIGYNKEVPGGKDIKIVSRGNR